MQTRAAARRQAQGRLRPNTATWVDSGYSRLLARQLRAVVSSRDNWRSFRDIRRLRRFAGYVAEESTPGGTVAYVLAGHISDPLRVVLTDLYYDTAGKLRIRESATPGKVCIGIMDHALSRLFERKRSNSVADLMPVFKALLQLPTATAAYKGREIAVAVPGGTVHVICDHEYLPKEDLYLMPAWIAKTFIPARDFRPIDHSPPAVAGIHVGETR